MDLFAFWADVSPSDFIHPRDRRVLSRIDHSFSENVLPTPFFGPLRTARIVLLYLSPGLDDQDVVLAKQPVEQARFLATMKGTAPLPGPDDHLPAWKWWSSRTRRFGPWERMRNEVAVLDISPYHSRTFKDWHALAALPSSRASLDWAQQTLFPQAERGERVVLCMRSPKWWGLGKKARYGEGLFVPAVGRGGHLNAANDEEMSRQDILDAVEAALSKPTFEQK